MTEPVPHRFRVLFVDDDRSFLDMARQAFTDLSDGSWEVFTARDAAATSTLLKQHPMDLIVLDVRMPEISGLQLISILQREYPEIPKVFLAAVVEESDRVAGLESGASLFLEKPAHHSGIQSIFATLHELLKWRQKQGTRGAPSHAGLLDLVKLECAAGNSRVFEVVKDNLRGQIYVKNGAIVHAEAPGRRGQSAFTHLATLLDAEFSLRQFVEPPERSVLRQWEFLYLEAVQLREQLIQAAAEARTKETGAAGVGERDDAAVSPAVDTSDRAEPAGVPLAAEVGAVAPAPAIEPQAPQPPRVSDEEATRQLFRRSPPSGPAQVESPSVPKPTTIPGAPAAAAAGTAGPSGPEVGETAPLRMLRPDHFPGAGRESEERAGTTLTSAAAGSFVEELLVCSYQAEVLYDWQCPGAARRLELVGTVRERSERLTQHLPLGPVDRLEFLAAGGRLLIHFQEDGAILMRSTTGSSPAAPGPGVLHQSMAGWLARHARVRGILAAGVIRPSPKPAISQPIGTELAAEALGVAWRCAQEMFELAARYELEPWQLRWVFDQAQLYAVRRSDGQALAMFLNKDSTALDTEAIERVFQEFRAVSAP
jgi:CheY-like chemotaxis protein